MALSTVMSRDDVDETTLIEIAETCDISISQIEDVYACTPLQTSTIAESTMRTGASVFQFVLTLAPSIDIDRFCDALRLVVSLNSILRTRLVDCRLGLLQVVTGGAHRTERLSGDVEHYLHDDKAKPMSLGVPLFRSAIIDRKLVLTMHHAVMDHSSIPPLFRDVLHVYHDQEPEARAPFKDFVKSCMSIDEATAKSFWASRFNGVPAIFPNVEQGFVPNSVQKFTRKVILGRIGAEISPAHVPAYIETAWALTAGVYTGSESVAFGLVLSGRTPTLLAGAETTLGPTIATIPVQVNLQRTATVEGILKERAAALRKLQVQAVLQYGISKIRSVSEAARVASRFQTVLNIRPSLSDANESSEVAYEYMNEPFGAFGLWLNCNLTGDGVLVEAISDPTILCARQLSRIVYQFEHILQSLMEAPPETKLGKLQLLNPHDRSEIMEWNDCIPKPVEKCVHELFSAQARERPEARAVEAWDGSVTYRELDEISNRLAHDLRRKGVSNGSPVAFIFEKSLWTVVSTLAIMKAGGACTPIARSDPHARKIAIVSNAKVKIILTSAAEHANSMDLAPEVIAVSSSFISGLPEIFDPISAAASSSAGDLAYIISTSGSTGVPKGVMLEHRGLATALTTFAQRFGWQPGFRVLQFASHIFDISIGEIFGALLSGGCVCIPSEETRESDLVGFIESKKIDWAWLTPTVLRTICPDDVPSLKALLSVGEPITADAYKTWGKSLRLINGWGPCEASVLSTAAELTPTSPYPESIGTPIGCATWIVNIGNPHELAPIGAIGEVIIEGLGVARGYMNDKVKTAASFLTAPAWAPSRAEGRRQMRFYRTGDLAKYYPDGTLCCVGRRDNQVKIRGQRFELGEIEAILSGCARVREVFTATKICSGRTELVAVVCLDDPQLPRMAALQELPEAYSEATTTGLRATREYARSKLPSYMVPAIWLAVEKLPRTESAKIDRLAIGEWLKKKNVASARTALDNQIVASLTPPETREEQLIQFVWCSVLGVPEQGIGQESSFVQLGGDSILAMQVASRCRKQGLQVTTSALLRGEPLSVIARSSTSKMDAELPNATLQNYHLNPSLIAAMLRQSSGYLRSEDVESVVPATDVQALMLATGEVGGNGYQVDFTLDFTPSLGTEKLKRACEQVVHHHPLLRTELFQHGPSLYQAVLKEAPAGIIVGKRGTSSLTLAFRERINLARFHLISDGQLCHRLHLEIHHVLYDAISLGLIFRDLEAAYAQRSLSDVPHFHSWISYVEGLDNSAARAYWKEMLKDSSMPYFVPPPVDAVRGNPLDEQVRICVPLENLKTPLGTPSSVMKSAWALLLSLALESDDIVFGEVSANRHLPFPGVDEVKGPCVNFLPVRGRLDRNMTIASLIKQVQDQTVASMSYHHLGFRSIIKDCTTWPRWTRFSSALVYQNHGSLGSLRIGGSDCTLSSQGKLGDSADIYVIAVPHAEDLEIELHFSSSTLPPEQVSWISRSLHAILEAIPSALEKTIGHVEESLRSITGSYTVPASIPTPPSKDLKGIPQSLSTQSQLAVSKAWDGVGLHPGDQSKDDSMFGCGADIVTALLLSKYYIYLGYHITTEDIVRNPSRSMQAYLLDLKRETEEQNRPGSDGPLSESRHTGHNSSMAWRSGASLVV
ncbi:NRPS [Diatrype stigma]|uniref:NRPS n=1 Tax=Diatrype stigma TaxID=117547 RepID=A0AAN9YWI3_9PEZI